MFQPDQMFFWNPLLIMLLIPLFDHFVYPTWRWCQPSLNPLHKMALGMVFMILCYIICGFVQLSVQNNPNNVSVFWQLPQHILLAVAEVLVSITILNFAYTQAPISLKAFTQSLRLLMKSIGSLAAGVLYSGVRGLKRDKIYLLLAGVMMANLIVFVFFARRYRFKDYSDEKCKVSHIEMEENVDAEQSSELACSADDQSNTGKVQASGSDERQEQDVVRRRKISKLEIIP